MYEELKLQTLEDRSVHADLTEVFKIVGELAAIKSLNVFPA